jgi:hypothetical protein
LVPPKGQALIGTMFQRSAKQQKPPDDDWDMAELDAVMKPQNLLDEQARRDGTGHFSTRKQIDGSVKTHNPDIDLNILDENQFKIDERPAALQRSVTVAFPVLIFPHSSSDAQSTRVEEILGNKPLALAAKDRGKSAFNEVMGFTR